MSDPIPLPQTPAVIIPPTQTELRTRINYAKSYVDRNYREGGDYAFIGEYPSVPLYIIVNRYLGQGSDPYSPRFLGHYWDANRLTGQAGSAPRSAFAAICDASERSSGIDFDEFTVSFRASQPPDEAMGIEYFKEWKMSFAHYGQPTLHIRREFSSSGIQTVTITLLAFRAAADVASVNLYYGHLCVAALIDQNTPVNTQWVVHPSSAGGDAKGLGSGRYTIRHGCQMARSAFEAFGETTKATKISNSISREGYTQDIYDPLFNKSLNEAITFFQEGDSWHDASKAHGYEPGHHTIDYYPYGYAYESKTHFFEMDGLEISQAAWIAYCIFDPYISCLQAIHVLNKGYDADHEYDRTDWDDFIPGWIPLLSRLKLDKTTPRQIAEDICHSMISDLGIGVFGAKITIDMPWIIPDVDLMKDTPMKMFNKASWSGSGYRTAAFAALCATLGYGPTDDDRFKPWADLMIRNLCWAQWGVYTDCANGLHANVDNYGYNRGATFGGQRLGMETRYRPDHTGGMMQCWEQSGTFRELWNVWEVPGQTPPNGLIMRKGEVGGDYNSGYSSLPYFVYAFGYKLVHAMTRNYFDLDGNQGYSIGARVKGTHSDGLKLRLYVYGSNYNLLETHDLPITQDYENWTQVSNGHTCHPDAFWGKLAIENSSGLPSMAFDAVFCAKSISDYAFGGPTKQRDAVVLASSKGGGGIPYVEDYIQPDPFNQPIECPVFLPTNMEATGAFIQALRIYNYHKYGDAYPSAVNLPTL
ncbi:MAG: hypothetical protein PHV74_00155 [Dehalococcoidia bacterium]|nr:hypothetical protein [Dehalococcoidia bacterium]